MKEISSLTDLIPDPENPNLGTERGFDLLEKSLRELGAGRSIVADKNGVVIAGNKTLEKAAELELPIEVVHTNGNRLVVVVRDDLDLLQDPKARKLSVADNRVQEVSLSWDSSVLQELRDNNAQALEGLWSETELDRLVAGQSKEPEDEKKLLTCPNCGAEIAK